MRFQKFLKATIVVGIIFFVSVFPSQSDGRTLVTPSNLTVNFAGNAAGAVILSPCTVSCTKTTNFTVSITQDPVTLTASTIMCGSANCSFINWTNGTGSAAICNDSTSLVCSFSINAVSSITANFARNVTLTTTQSGNGAGTISDNAGTINGGARGSTSYSFNSIVDLFATPNANSTFSGWSGACSGTDPDICSVTMNADKNVTANFQGSAPAPGPTAVLTLNRAGDGTGRILNQTSGSSDCPQTCSISYPINKIVVLTADAFPFNHFDGWSDACVSFVLQPNCIITMTSDLLVTAIFSINKNQLNISKNGDGTGMIADEIDGSGQINCGATCSANYSYNSTINLFYTDGSNSTFSGWSGACTGNNTCNVIMNANRTVNAQFMADRVLTVAKNGPAPGDVTILDSSQGLIDCGATCIASYPYNTQAILTAIEEPFTQFTGWQGAGCSGTGNCIITMKNAKTVTANFSLLPQSLTITPTGLGAGTITSSPAGIDCGLTTFDCNFDFSFGAIVALTATPDADSQFIQWSGDCSGAGSGGSSPGTCSVTLDQPRDITAEFEPKITDTSNPDLRGWAWSSTIGWLSFNCIDTNSCGQSDYRVEIDPITGLLSGWAWSSSVGWVQFDPTGPYPADPQTSAMIDVNTGIASGWVRILSYQNAQIIGFNRQNQKQNFSLNKNSEAQTQINNTDFDSLINFFKNIFNQNFNLTNPDRIFAQTAGFGDGWLQIISGPAATALNIPETQRKNDNLRGWAWGGEPIGWLSFSGATYKTSIPSPSCSFTSDKKNVSPTQSVTLTWACDFSVSCSLNEGIGEVDPFSGSVVNQPTKNVTVYQLTCTGLGTTQSWSVEVRKFQSPRKEIRPR